MKFADNIRQYINGDDKKELSISIGDIDFLLIYIDEGEYLMGSPKNMRHCSIDEQPLHCVKISRPFYLAKFPVTVSQWNSFSDFSPFGGRDYGARHDDAPATHISWMDAKEYIGNISRISGLMFRLPTEAEWEYCARAGTSSMYYWGDDDSPEDIDKYAWNYHNTGKMGIKNPQPVGRKLPNGFGIYDMAGNIWEWCEDWYNGDYYLMSPLYDPRGPKTGTRRSLRGGSWGDDTKYLRCGVRDSYFPDRRWYLNGFRLLLEEFAKGNVFND